MANQKITQFTEATSFSADTDLIPIVINTDSTPANRKITKANFEAGIASGLSTKAGTISSASFQITGSGDSFATATFATPFSSSDYSVALEFEISTYINYSTRTSIVDKTPAGFTILTEVGEGIWGFLPDSSINYIAVANGETAVTSSYTLLAATASYVEDSEKYTDTEISSAQILDLHNTPVTLIPEPTDGSFSYPSKVFIKYIFNTTAYTQAASNDIQVRVAGYTGAVLGEQFNSTTIVSTADYQKITSIIQISEPDAFSTKLYSPAAITGGDGTIKIRTYYSVIPNTF